MASTLEVVISTSPPPPSRSPQQEPVVVVDSDDEQDGEPNSKRRRTIYASESSGNVIDLTEGDERNSTEGFRFKIIPKIIRLPPFQFTEHDDEPDGMPLETLREHLHRLFGTGVIGEPPEEPPSPIDPDDLEITGVKESTNPSSSSSSSITTTTTTTVTATAIPTTKRGALSSSKEKEKEKEEKGKGKEGEVSLECAICLGSMKRITATTCGHVFCYECIKQAIQVTKCCPMCKKKLTLRSIHPLYL